MNSNTENIIALLQKTSELAGIELKTPAVLTKELPIHISLIGQPQQNLFGILHELADHLADLNRPLYRSFRCTISFGEERVCTIQNGEMRDTTVPDLAQMLSQFDNAAAPVLCEIFIPHEALKNVNLQLVSSGKDYADVDWEQTLMESDYCYFTLTATALLSLCERKVLRNYLLPEMEGQLGILTINDHLILSADRSDIDDSLNRFFKGHVPILSTEQEDFSLLAELEKKASAPEDYRQARSKRSVRLCLKEAVHQLDLQIQVLSKDSEALEDAMAILEEKAQTLPSHMKTACRRARMQYTSQMKMDVTERASNFHHALKEQIQKDVEKRKDISKLQNVLPSYITSQWESEIEGLKAYIEEQANQMQESLRDYIEKDICDYIKSGIDMATAEYIFCLTNMYGKEEIITNAPDFDFRDKGYRVLFDVRSFKYKVIAGGVALLMLSHPLLATGAAVMLVKGQKDSLLAENRQGLIEAADKMSKEIFDQVVIQLDNTIRTLEYNLNTAVETCYQKIMDTMVQALTNRKHDQNSYAEKLEQLNSIRSEMTVLLK